MRHYIFSDEAGCLAFSRKQNVSRYFILCTVTMRSCEIGERLQHLRRRMAWDGLAHDNVLHATTDAQAVRDRVFSLLAQEDFRIDSTILEKSKAAPQTRASESRFYQYAWYYHLKYLGPNIATQDDEVFLAAASIGTRKKKTAFLAALNDVAQQALNHTEWRTIFWPAMSDPCLQVADYCAWALQRKWEKNDTRSYNLIRDKISSEYELWERGKRHYY